MSSGYVDFNSIRFEVPANGQVKVELFADFSTSVSGKVFSTQITSIEAKDSNSNNSTVVGVDSTTNGPVYTFIASGNLSVNYNSDTPPSKLLAATSTEQEVARFTLGATEDSLKITDLYLVNATDSGTVIASNSKVLVYSGTTLTGTLSFNGTYRTFTGEIYTGATAIATTITILTGSTDMRVVNEDLASRLSSITLYNSDSSVSISGTIEGGVVSFNIGDSSKMLIDKNNSNYNVIVKATFNPITDSGQTGKIVRLVAGVTPDSHTD